MLRIRKNRKRAEIVYTDQSRQEGNFFVSLASSRRRGPESIGEILNGERRFLPFEVQDGHLMMVQRSAILMVRPKDSEVDEIAQTAGRVFAQVMFISGYSVSGYVYNDLPSSYPRLSDYLNGTGLFFHLEIDSEDYLINSELVKLVTSGAPDR